MSLANQLEGGTPSDVMPTQKYSLVEVDDIVLSFTLLGVTQDAAMP